MDDYSFGLLLTTQATELLSTGLPITHQVLVLVFVAFVFVWEYGHASLPATLLLKPTHDNDKL